jgi:hypothetical protein
LLSPAKVKIQYFVLQQQKVVAQAVFKVPLIKQAARAVALVEIKELVLK